MPGLREKPLLTVNLDGKPRHHVTIQERNDSILGSKIQIFEKIFENVRFKKNVYIPLWGIFLGNRGMVFRGILTHTHFEWTVYSSQHALLKKGYFRQVIV